MNAAILTVSFPVILLSGTSAHNDVPLIFFCLAVLNLLAMSMSRASVRRSVMAGLTLGAGVLSKYHMVFLYPVLLAYLIVFGLLRSLAMHWMLALVISVCMVFGWLHAARELEIIAVQQATMEQYSGRFVVSGSAWSQRMLFENLVLNLPRYLGVYALPLIGIGLWTVLRSRTPADRFLILWVLLFSIPVLLTLPDARYFMPAFPALALIAGRALPSSGGLRARVLSLGLLYCGISLWLMELTLMNVRALSP